MASTTTSEAPLFTCPACDDKVTATFVVALSLDEAAGVNPADGTLSALATVVGVKVTHDCAPKVTRKHRATKTAEPAPSVKAV
jgi:hypothetical protein